MWKDVIITFQRFEEADPDAPTDKEHAIIE
jgi:hypothetical protein